MIVPYGVLSIYLSLTTATSNLAAIANDYGYQDVFACQRCGLVYVKDLLIAFNMSVEAQLPAHKGDAS